MGHGNPRFRAHLGSCRHGGAGKPRFPRTWTAPVATRHGNPKLQRQTRQAVSTPPRNGNPEFARLGRFFIVPQHGNREFHKLWRFRSRCDMETQVPGGRWRPQRFPSCHETESPRVPRTRAVLCCSAAWKPELPAPRSRFPSCHGMESPGFGRLGRPFPAARWHGNPKLPKLGRPFPVAR